VGRVRFPYIPKSTAGLQPGDFWSIPLAGERYACGRVLAAAHASHPGSTRLFLAGLLEWLGEMPPTAESIAGRGVLAAGLLHVKSVAECGGEMLGTRPLEADAIDPAEYIPEPPTWGYAFPQALAEARLLGRPRATSGDAAG
jgi:hypothetical protein